MTRRRRTSGIDLPGCLAWECRTYGSHTPVISTGGGGTFAASPAFSYPANPNPVGRFEVARTGQEPVVRTGKLNGVGFAGELFTAGTHQFRARVEDGDRASDWSPWCMFEVEPA